MLSKIRIFPITSFGTDGYPVVAAPIKLVTIKEGETEVNNIRVKITPTVKIKTLNADDREEEHKAIVGYKGDMEAYGVDAAALAALQEVEKDTNGNINHLAGTGTEKPVVVFFEGKNEKGVKFQKWLYKVKFDPITEECKTEDDSGTSVSLSFVGEVIQTGSVSRVYATVYHGNKGWVDGEPTAQDLYKQPTA